MDGRAFPSSRLLQLGLKHLVAFEALYSTRNLSRAAALVGFAQPTMSNLLARMREAQDDPLFVRHAGGMQPTARADEMIVSVRKILNEMGAITHDTVEFDPTTLNREFRILTTDMFESLVMPRLAAAFEQTPDIRFKLMSAPQITISEALESGKADLSLGVPSPNVTGLAWEVLMPIAIVAIARKGNPAIRGPLSLQDFRMLGHASLDFDPGAMANVAILKPAERIERRDVVRVTRVGSVIELVARSNLVGVVPAAQLAASPYREGLQIVDVPLPELTQQFHMTWHERNAQDKALKWLRSRIIEILNEDWADYL